MMNHPRLTCCLYAATLLTICAIAPNVSADVTLPKVFGNGMVLQRGMAVPVWGWADTGEKVTVSFAGQTKTTEAGKNGKWMVKLDALKANSKPAALTVSGGNKITLENVLVGEVWICSGQSNMEWSVNRSMNAKPEREAANYPMIRLFNVPGHTTHPLPQEKGKGAWQTCSPKTVGNFSAVGYYFGRRLHKEIDVPIGLIGSNWGGTRIEPWTPLVGFQSVPQLKRFAVQVKGYTAKTRVGGGSPAAIYNSMVNHLTPFAMRGCIWYQGESNGGEGESYYHKMHGLVKGWRNVFQNKDLAFYWVQLANWRAENPNPAGGDGWAKIRQAQTKALDLPHTGMAVIIDIGDARDIHPRNKQDVGWRLAQWALHQTYGKKDLVPSGPMYTGHKVEGDAIRISFKHVGKGLMVGKKSGLKPTQELKEGELQHFAIAGKDRQWHWANATIDGETVVVKSPKVSNPVAVRYAYAMNPAKANLYNKDGIPAAPFRTDKWLGAKEKLGWNKANKQAVPNSVPGASTTLLLHNQAGRTVKLFWIPYGGGRRFYAELEPGAKRKQNTYANASWLITDQSDQPLGYFRTTQNIGVAVIPKQ